MTRESGDQPTRLTVAELLAQHGKSAGGSRHRHRRRAEDDAAEAESDVTTTAPQAIIDRIHSEAPDVDWQARRRNGHAHGAPDREDRAPQQPEATNGRPANGHPASGYNRAVPPPRPQGRPWRPAQNEPHRPVSSRLDGLTEQPRAEPVAPTPAQPPPPPPPQRRSRRPMRHIEPQTEQFAAVADEDSGRYACHGAGVQQDSPQDLEDSNEDLELALADVDRPDDADYSDYDELAEFYDAEALEDDRTPGQQWLAVGAQLALGVVGGAAVWLVFNWLWMSIPALALAAALIVIAGLVWIVRKIRKAEDLQSTVLAVLVGLVVTVSPAALLLLSK